MRPTLQEEIRQKKPFVSVEEEAMLSIRRTAAQLEHAGGEVLKDHGLTVTQYNALRILRGAGEAGLCRNDIRDRLIARVPDATRCSTGWRRLGWSAEIARAMIAATSPAGSRPRGSSSWLGSIPKSRR
jgi:hypothetical protein